MKDAKRALLQLSCIPTIIACSASFAPPARTSGPSEVRGVQVSILTQYCEEETDPDWEGNQVVQIRMNVGVSNRGASDVAVHADGVRLVAPNGVTLTPTAADDALTVPPGEMKAVRVRFMNRGSLSCRQVMKFDPGAGVVVDGRPVPIDPIAFVPRNRD